MSDCVEVDKDALRTVIAIAKDRRSVYVSDKERATSAIQELESSLTEEDTND